MKPQGFTLIETMFSIGLLAISVLSLCAVLITTLKLSGQNRDVTVAAQSAHQILEQIRSGVCPPSGNSVFNGQVNDAKKNATGFPPAPYPQQVIEGQTYQYKVVTQETPTRPGLYDITVYTYWSGNHQTVLQSHVFLP